MIDHLQQEAAARGVGRYKMRTITRLTGLSAALLRAWERRHGLLEPARGDGGHRLYTEDDLSLLRRVSELIRQGRSIGEIALRGRHALLEEASRAASAAGASMIADSGPDGDQEEIHSRVARYQQAIVSAGSAFDSERLERTLDEVFALFSPDTAIHSVIEPAARLVGDLWSAGRLSVASEHLISNSFEHRIGKLLESAAPGAVEGTRVICVSFPDEQHHLGAMIVAYRLCRSGFRVSYLGSSLPLEDLESACEAFSARAVMLSVARPALFLTHRPRLAELAARQRSVEFFVGGLGADERDEALNAAGVTLWSHDRTITELPEVLRAAMNAAAVLTSQEVLA